MTRLIIKDVRLKRGPLAKILAAGLDYGEPALCIDNPLLPKLYVGDKDRVPRLASGSGGASDWDSILGKPSAFAPSSHSHLHADLPAYPTLASLGAASASHTHGDADLTGLAWSKLSGVPATFAPSAHSHSFASLTSLPTTLSGYGITDAASSSHSHTGTYQPLDADLTAIAALSGTSGLLKKTAADTWALDGNSYALSSHTHDYSGIFAALSHSHAFASLTSKPTTLSGYGITDAASSTHSHTGTYQPLDADLTAIAALSGTSGFLKKTAADTWALDTNSYALSSHVHAYSSLTGIPSTFTPSSHSHAWGDISGRPSIGSIGTVVVQAVAGSNQGCTTDQFLTWLQNQGFFNYSHSWAKCSWDYAGNNEITDTSLGSIEMAGCVIRTYINGSERHIEIIRPTTGTGGFQVLVYNNQGSGYAPGWRHYITSENISGQSVYYASTAPWSGISGKPTTLLGYGISDAINSQSGKLASATRGSGVDLRFKDISNGLTYAVYLESGNLKVIQV